MKGSRVILVLLPLLLGVVAVDKYGFVLRLGLIQHSEMLLLDRQLYVDPDIDPDRVEILRSAWAAATARVQQRFGLTGEPPIIVVTMHQGTAERFGLFGNSGVAYALPWRHYILVRWRNDLTDLLAHELMHARIRDISGYWSYLIRMPTWLDEGLAMQVDDRSHYDFDSKGFSRQEIARVKSLRRAGQFWSHDPAQNVRNYRAAKAAVRLWLETNPDQDIRELIMSMGEIVD